ncbi:MAG: bile acid:sodium symporter family protein [Gemmataceae bacterium]
MNTASLVSLLNVTALVTIMLAMGLQVKFKAVTASVRPVHRVALGLLANYGLVPAVTVGLLSFFAAAPMVSAGFLILAVCPGAPIGPMAAKIARGNVAWSIGMMIILAGLSAVLSPALLSLLLKWVTPDSELHIDYLAIVRTLLIAQLLPLGAGLAIHHRLPRLTAKIVRPVGMAANLMLLVLIGLILATQYQTLAAIQLRGWTGMSLLFVASLVIGWLCGGADGAIRKALAVTTSGRNAAVGLAIVTSNFAGTPAVTAVVAYALVSILGTFVAAALLGTFAGAARGPAPAEPALVSPPGL